MNSLQPILSRPAFINLLIMSGGMCVFALFFFLTSPQYVAVEIQGGAGGVRVVLPPSASVRWHDPELVEALRTSPGHYNVKLPEGSRSLSSGLQVQSVSIAPMHTILPAIDEQGVYDLEVSCQAPNVALTPWGIARAGLAIRVSGASESLRAGAIVIGPVVPRVLIGAHTIWSQTETIPEGVRQLASALANGASSIGVAALDFVYIPSSAVTLGLHSPWLGPIIISDAPASSDAVKAMFGQVYWAALAAVNRMPDSEPGPDLMASHGFSVLWAEAMTSTLIEHHPSLVPAVGVHHHASWTSARRDRILAGPPLDYDVGRGPSISASPEQRRCWQQDVCAYVVAQAISELGESFSSVFRAWLSDRVMEIQPLRLLLWERIEHYRSFHRVNGLLTLIATRDITGIEYPPTDVERNGRTVLLRLSANTEGFLEHCGCVVSQSGGAARRVTALRAPSAWPSVSMDLGFRFAPVPTISTTNDYREEASLIESLTALCDYDIVVPDVNDLILMNKLGLVRATEADVCSNHREPVFNKIRAIELAGDTLGVIGYADSLHRHIKWGTATARRALIEDNAAIDLMTPASVKRDIQEFRTQRPLRGYLICAGSFSVDAAHRLIDEGARPDLIVTSNPVVWARHGLDEASPMAWSMDSHRYRGVPIAVLRGGTYGLDEILVSLGDDGLQVLKHSVVNLNGSIADAVDARGLITLFYELQAKTETDSNSASKSPGPEFVGSKACQQCHPAAYGIWKTQGHGQAMNTLIRARRHFRPSCVVCHSVGYGSVHGYSIGDPDVRELAHVGCESCHGAARDHINQPSKTNISRRAPESVCLQCHDSKHSPEFNHRVFMERIRHW